MILFVFSLAEDFFFTQIKNLVMWAMRISAFLEALKSIHGVQLPAEFQNSLQLMIAEMPHLQLAEGIHAPEVRMDDKGKEKTRHFNNAVGKVHYDQCLGPREREMQ